MEIHVTAILLQMLNFGIVAGLLTFLLFKPVRKILDERSRKVAEGQKAADEALKEKSRISEHVDAMRRDAQKDAKKIVSEARSEAEAKKAELLKEVKAEVAEEREKMLESLEREKANALKAQQKEFEQAVIAVAEHVVGASLDAKKHAKLIDQGLKDIAASK